MSKEERAVVYLSAAPGPLRWRYRQKINALVYQAMVEWHDNCARSAIRPRF